MLTRIIGNKSQAYHFSLDLIKTMGNRKRLKTDVVFTRNVSRVSFKSLKKEPGAAIMNMIPKK